MREKMWERNSGEETEDRVSIARRKDEHSRVEQHCAVICREDKSLSLSLLSLFSFNRSVLPPSATNRRLIRRRKT